MEIPFFSKCFDGMVDFTDGIETPLFSYVSFLKNFFIRHPVGVSEAEKCR